MQTKTRAVKSDANKLAWGLAQKLYPLISAAIRAGHNPEAISDALTKLLESAIAAGGTQTKNPTKPLQRFAGRIPNTIEHNCITSEKGGGALCVKCRMFSSYSPDGLCRLCRSLDRKYKQACASLAKTAQIPKEAKNG